MCLCGSTGNIFPMMTVFVSPEQGRCSECSNLSPPSQSKKKKNVNIVAVSTNCVILAFLVSVRSMQCCTPRI